MTRHERQQAIDDRLATMDELRRQRPVFAKLPEVDVPVDRVRLTLGDEFAILSAAAARTLARDLMLLADRIDPPAPPTVIPFPQTQPRIRLHRAGQS